MSPYHSELIIAAKLAPTWPYKGKWGI